MGGYDLLRLDLAVPEEPVHPFEVRRRSSDVRQARAGLARHRIHHRQQPIPTARITELNGEEILGRYVKIFTGAHTSKNHHREPKST